MILQRQHLGGPIRTFRHARSRSGHPAILRIMWCRKALAWTRSSISPAARHIQAVQRCAQALRLAAQRPIAGEIVGTDQRLTRRVHRVRIQWPVRPGRAPASRLLRRAVQNQVAVTA